MGELLGEMDLDKGAATPSQNEIASPQKLSDLGIDHNQSHRYQRMVIKDLAKPLDLICCTGLFEAKMFTARHLILYESVPGIFILI